MVVIRRPFCGLTRETSIPVLTCSRSRWAVSTVAFLLAGGRRTPVETGNGWDQNRPSETTSAGRTGRVRPMELPRRVVDLLSRNDVLAYLATVMTDGSPHV